LGRFSAGRGDNWPEYNTWRTVFNMKARQLYDELRNLAGSMGITVVEHNFRATGTKARSGLCRIRGRWHYIVDKHRTVREKVELLADCLAPMDHEGHYVLPAVREILGGRGEPAGKPPAAPEVGGPG